MSQSPDSYRFPVSWLAGDISPQTPWKFYFAYTAELAYHCMGFREWLLHLRRVPLQQKGWKTLAQGVVRIFEWQPPLSQMQRIEYLVQL